MTTLLGLELTDRAVLVVGGGPVAARRTQALVADGARVSVVAPDVCETIRDLHLAGDIELHRRDVERSDLNGAWLVHTATGDSVTDLAVKDGDLVVATQPKWQLSSSFNNGLKRSLFPQGNNVRFYLIFLLTSSSL